MGLLKCSPQRRYRAYLALCKEPCVLAYVCQLNLVPFPNIFRVESRRSGRHWFKLGLIQVESRTPGRSWLTLVQVGPCLAYTGTVFYFQVHQSCGGMSGTGLRQSATQAGDTISHRRRATFCKPDLPPDLPPGGQTRHHRSSQFHRLFVRTATLQLL